jgi:hypothetical protein
MKWCFISWLIIYIEKPFKILKKNEKKVNYNKQSEVVSKSWQKKKICKQITQTNEKVIRDKKKTKYASKSHKLMKNAKTIKGEK